MSKRNRKPKTRKPNLYKSKNGPGGGNDPDVNRSRCNEGLKSGSYNHVEWTARAAYRIRKPLGIPKGGGGRALAQPCRGPP